MAPEAITLYVQLADVGESPRLLLYEEMAEGVFRQVSGDLGVGADGAEITFVPHPEPGITPWHFNSCVIHPLGPSTASVGLNWLVQPAQVKLQDTGTVARRPRSFSYTLSVETDDASLGAVTKFYLDPKLVNTGGT